LIIQLITNTFAVINIKKRKIYIMNQLLDPIRADDVAKKCTNCAFNDAHIHEFNIFHLFLLLASLEEIVSVKVCNH